MSSPRVSIIVPVYNAGGFLAGSLDSILSQDLEQYELLISDDRSTDNSLEIIQKYAATDARIRWWQNARNLGQTGNHNACLREARGEFIKFVHQDDTLLSAQAIGKLVAVLAANPRATLAGSASTVVDGQGRLLDRRAQFRAGVSDGKEIIRATFEAVGNPIGEPSVVLFRSSAAKRGFSNDYKQLWDLEMWYHLLEQGDFVYVDEPLCAFRQHAAQQSAANHRSGIGPGEMFKLLKTYYAKPWLHEIASQRMLINQARFLKKNPQLGESAAILLAEIRSRIRATSYPIYWVERKTRHSLSNIRKAAIKRQARQDSND